MKYIRHPLTEKFIANPYKYLDEINHEVYKVIIEEFTSLYGAFPDELIKKRLHDEWVWSQQTNTSFTIGLLYDFIQVLLSFDIPYSPRFLCNSSLIFYVLGITKINPLPPHYHCPCCHTIIWDNNKKCGLDLKHNIRCPKDGTFMQYDGFDIPWQTNFMDNNSNIGFELSLSPEMHETTMDILDDMGVDYKTYHRTYYRKEIQIIETGKAFVQFNLPEKINDVEPPLLYLRNFNNEIIIRQAQQYAHLTTPALKVNIDTIADVISYMGIIRSDFNNDEKLKVLINTLGYTPSELIACRQDLFKYYLEHNCDEQIAYNLMSNVRKGKYFLNNFPSPEMHMARDKWVVSFCEDIRYLPSKTETVEDLLFNLLHRPDACPFESLLEY